MVVLNGRVPEPRVAFVGDDLDCEPLQIHRGNDSRFPDRRVLIERGLTGYGSRAARLRERDETVFLHPE